MRVLTGSHGMLLQGDGERYRSTVLTFVEEKVAAMELTRQAEKGRGGGGDHALEALLSATSLDHVGALLQAKNVTKFSLDPSLSSVWIRAVK